MTVLLCIAKERLNTCSKFSDYCESCDEDVEWDHDPFSVLGKIPSIPWKIKKKLIRRQAQYILCSIHTSTVPFSLCCSVFMRQLHYTNIRKWIAPYHGLCCFVFSFSEAEFCGGPLCVIRKLPCAMGKSILWNIYLDSCHFQYKQFPVAAERGKRRIHSALRRYLIIQVLTNNATF
jgi:hypothetical protein